MEVGEGSGAVVTHLYLEGPVDAFEELLLMPACCPQSKVVEVSSVDTIGAEQGSPGVSAHWTATPPFLVHVARWALLCWAQPCKVVLLLDPQRVYLDVVILSTYCFRMETMCVLGCFLQPYVPVCPHMLSQEDTEQGHPDIMLTNVSHGLLLTSLAPRLPYSALASYKTIPA